MATRNRKLTELFYGILAKSSVFTLYRPGGREFTINEKVDDEHNEYFCCFSNSSIAEQTLQYFRQIPGNRKISIDIKSMSAEQLFFLAGTRHVPIYLNPKSHPDARFFFNIKKIENLLACYWNQRAVTQTVIGAQGQTLKRSRQGRRPIEDGSTQISMPEIALEH